MENYQRPAIDLEKFRQFTTAKDPPKASPITHPSTQRPVNFGGFEVGDKVRVLQSYANYHSTDISYPFDTVIIAQGFGEYWIVKQDKDPVLLTSIDKGTIWGWLVWYKHLELIQPPRFKAGDAVKIS